MKNLKKALGTLLVLAMILALAAPALAVDITIDDGAATALHSRRKSLLPIGVVDCNGAFNKGDIVLILDKKGNEIARGLSNYAMKDVLLIRGKKSREIRALLDSCPYEEIVHSDNIQLTDAM